MRVIGRACLLASTAGMLFMPSMALAQASNDGDRANIGDIVVAGRRSIDTPAAEIKRVSPGIVDSITSSEIDKTTDTTLAEALARVVGVSADAFYGTTDAGYVSIRGFDSRYNSMELDGNPIWFSSQNNRGAQIGLFPSSIVKETSVYKTVTADQDANSVGGHIALRTLRAFDGGNRPYVSINAQLGGYEQPSKVNGGPSGRVNGAGKFTFGPDHRLGAVLGFSIQRYRSTDDYGGVDSYNQINGSDQVNGNLYSTGSYDKMTFNKALYAKLETQISDRLYGFVSGNLFDETKDLYLQRGAVYIYQANGRTTNYADGTASFTGGQGQTREYDYDMHRKAKVAGAGLDYELFDKATINFRGNYTDYRNDILTRYPEAFILSNVAGTYDVNGNEPSVTITSPVTYTDPSTWQYRNTSATYNRTQNLHDRVWSLKGDVRYNVYDGARGLGFVGGVNWTRLDRGFNQDQANYTLAKTASLKLAQAVPAGPTMANYDALKFDWNSFWSYIYANGILSTDLAPTTDYGLTEDMLAGHGTFYWTGDRFRLLAGLRYEHTSDATDTANLVKSVVTPVHRTNTYGNWLPNVQGQFDFTPRLRLRAAFTKTLGRPDFADFAPGQTTAINANGIPVISGTNPQLAPRVSTNYDTSLEYYFHNGLLSLAVFHKDLAHETFSQQTNVYDTSGALTAIETVPLNTGSARVTGIEASASKSRLDFLPAPFSRFGLAINGAWFDGTWNVVFTDGTTRSVGGLRNQPKWLGNARLSYDAGPLDLDLSWTKRGRTFTGTFGTTAVGDRWIAGYDTLDFHAALTVRRGAAITFDARNLTKSYIRQTTGLTDAVYNSVGAGRSFYGGVRLSL